MSGYVGDLSPQQESALQQVKQLVADVHKLNYDDHYYLRWLRARNFDPRKAETMIRKNLIFRKKIGADTILEDYKPPEIIDKHYPRGLLGPDKEGCPVRYMPYANLDLRGFVYSVKKSDVLKFLTFMFEQDIAMMKEESLRLGKEIEKHSYIVDLEGYTFRQATNRQAVDMLNEVLRLYEANYPERMKTAYFIHAPQYFSIVLALSRPFLSEATLKKFRVFSKDNYQDALLNDIDADILPKFLGGNRTDADGNPKCYSIITYGSFIPKSSYFTHGHSNRNFPDEEGVRSVVLEKRSSQSVEIPVQTSGCRLQWEFETPNHDVGVGLYKKRSTGPEVTKDSLEEILPVERVNCHLVPESFVYICESTGTYVLKFDNSYSWFSSKKVFYRITTTSPDEYAKME